MRKILLMIGAVLALATLGPVTEASAHGRWVAVRTPVVHRVVVPVKRVVWRPVVVRSYAVRYVKTFKVRYARVWHGHHRWYHHHYWHHRWHYRHHWYHRCWCRC